MVLFLTFKSEEPGYDLQIAFCRVTSINDGDDNNDGVPEFNPSLTVEGGPFRLLLRWI